MEETDKKVALITDRLQEVLGLEELKELVANRSPKIYWGTATTGKIHIGYLVPLLKIADFLNADCEVKILFADIHAMLDNMKSTPDLIESRCAYYEKIIKSILVNLNVPMEKLTFVRGSSFQLSEKYTMDVLKLSSLSSIHDAKKAGAEVVKKSDNPKLSGLLYPILQSLDEEYLGVDIQAGGIDQKKIMVFSRNLLPMLGYKKRIHLMNPMLTAINAMPKIEEEKGKGEDIEEENIADTKMSSSDPNSKIDFLDSKNEIKKKINRAYCLEGDLTFNPLMELTKHVVFPLLKNQGIASLLINRHEKHGGPLTYDSYEILEAAFVEKKLHPQDLKMGVADCINNFCEKIRKEFSSKENIALIKKAYP